MEGEDKIKLDPAEEVKNIMPAAIAVITGPADFFRGLPKSGGYLRPLLFIVVLSAVSGLLGALLSLAGLGPASGLATGLFAIVLMPILAAIFGFIAAAILFVIWKLMGSRESFETAYRCLAYTAAIMPVTTVLNLIPYVGPVIGLVWMTFLLVTASTEVHTIKKKTAWAGFGAICAVLVLISVSAEIAGRKMAGHMQSWPQESQGEMTPEEASRIMGDLLKGLQQER